MLRLIFLTIMICCASQLAKAQHFTLKGSVSAAITEEPLPGAHLWVKGDFERSAVSDSTGAFRIKAVKKRDTIICSFLGFKEMIFVVEAHEFIYLRLSPSNVELNEISVRATRLGAENFTFEKLEPIQIYKNPNAKADPLVAINTSKSSTTTDENAAVAFRGASPEQTAYFLNGVPLKEPLKYAQLSNTGTLSIFNTGFLKSATVFAGNPPLEYGQSSSGTIAIELADRFPDYHEHSASISLANLGYSYKGPLGENTSIGVFTNFQFDEALKGLNPVSFENINHFASTEAGILINTHQAWGSIKFYQYGLLDEYEFNFEHPSYSGPLTQEAKRSISTLKWVNEFGNWQSSIIMGMSINQKTFEGANMDFEQADTDPYFNINQEYSDKSIFIKMGYAYWSQQSSFVGAVPRFEYAMHPEHPNDKLHTRSALESHEAYTYARKELGNHSVGLGLRAGESPQFTENLLSYQLNYRYAWNDNLSVKAAHGEYFQLNPAFEQGLVKSKQTGLDFKLENKRFASEHSIFLNRSQGQNISGLENNLHYEINTKLSIDQQLSVYDSDKQLQWFSRSFLEYEPIGGLTITLSHQSFSGEEIRTVQQAIYNPQLDVFRPTNWGQEQLNLYANTSLSVSKILTLGENTNAVAFFTLNNIFDQKNTLNRTYDRDYSQYSTNYLSRRSFYCGVVINWAHGK